MKKEIHEIKHSKEVIGQAEIEQFESIEEAVRTLGDRAALVLLNSAHKAKQLLKEKARYKAKLKDKSLTDFVLNQYSLLTSEKERETFCKWLGVDKAKIDDLFYKTVITQNLNKKKEAQ